MRKLWVEYKGVLILFAVWRLVVLFIELAAVHVIPPNPQFLEPVRWANFDGGHYLSIAGNGYGMYQQAFFPLYPLLIRAFSFLPTSPVYIALVISHASLIGGILILHALLKKEHIRNALWIIALLLFFPTGFFFVSVYPTSLLFFFIVASMLAARSGRWGTAGLFGLLASATHLFGLFLFPFVLWEYVKTSPRNWKTGWPIVLIPVGLLLYMGYLYLTTGDALAFFHVQRAFGANRSGGAFVLLPQVIWRYGNILLTVPYSFTYAVAVFELSTFLFFGILLLYGLRQKMRMSYLLYSTLVLIVPTLTGTLSSIPRYVLSAFPLFFALGTVHSHVTKGVIGTVLTAGFIICTAAFLSGYFIA